MVKTTDLKPVKDLLETYWEVMDNNTESAPVKFPERKDDVAKLHEGDLAICSDGTIGVVDDIDLYYNSVLIYVVASKTHEVGEYALYQPWLSGIRVDTMYHLDKSFKPINGQLLFWGLHHKK